MYQSRMLSDDSRTLAEVADSLEAVAADIGSNVDRLSGATGCADDLFDSNRKIVEAAQLAEQVAEAAEEQVSSSAHNVETLAEVRSLAEAIQGIHQKLEEVISSLSRVNDVSGRIEIIARQTRMLALNATIEAARAGEAGRGFQVVATEVKSLAQQTSEATTGITDTVRALTEGIQDLAQKSAATVAAADRVRSATGEIAESIDDFNTIVELVRSHIGEILHLSSHNLSQCGSVRETIGTVTGDLGRDAARLMDTSRHAGTLLRSAEGHG